MIPELSRYETPNAAWLRWLWASGVKTEAIIHPSVILVASGIRAHDGRFEEDPEGDYWLAFQEPKDVVYWHPGTGELATLDGRAFALGEAVVDKSATYAFDCHLNIFADPLDWLRNRRDGIVIIRWEWAFDRLRNKSRVAVAEGLLPLYRQHMQPLRLPDVFVIPNEQRGAA